MYQYWSKLTKRWLVVYVAISTATGIHYSCTIKYSLSRGPSIAPSKTATCVFVYAAPAGSELYERPPPRLLASSAEFCVDAKFRNTFGDVPLKRSAEILYFCFRFRTRTPVSRVTENMHRRRYIEYSNIIHY